MKFHIPQFCLLEFTKFSQKNKTENKKYPVFLNNFFNIGDASKVIGYKVLPRQVR